MDKVDLGTSALLNPSLLTGLKQEAKSQKNKKVSTNQKNLFSELMEASSSELGPLVNLPPSETIMTELMDAVHSTGSDLLDRPFQEEIINYKRAVRDFINYIVKNGYEFVKSQGIKRKVIINGEAEWKATVYHQVRIVDQKLDELAAMILSDQSNQLIRVSRVDEIKGLLVDLTITGMIKESND